MEVLAAWLDEIMHKIVIDETGLQGNYDFQLIEDPRMGTTIEAIKTNLAELGLELRPARRKVSAVYIEVTGQPAAIPTRPSGTYAHSSKSWCMITRQSSPQE